MNQLRRSAVGLVAFGLLVAACSSSGDDVATADTTTTTGDDPAVTSSADPTTSSPSSTGAGEPLTASYRGVTPDVIRIGVAVPDFGPLGDIGVETLFGDADVAFQVFFDEINEAGGLGGRLIEPSYAVFDFLDPITQDTVCRELTQGNEVFLVMHGVLRDGNFCFTETNDTIIITEKELTAERMERSGETPWLTNMFRDDVALELSVQVLFDLGRLDGKTVGIAGGDETQGVDAIDAALTDLGIEAKVAVISAPPGDLEASRAEYAIVAESFKADGVDFVFVPGDTGIAIEALEINGVGAEYVLSDAAVLAAIPEAMDDPSLADGATTVSFLPDDQLWEHPDFAAECVAPFAEAHPELADELAPLPTEVDMGAGEPQWIVPIRRACYGTRLLAALITQAGPDLTYDSLIAALDEIGPVEYPGLGQANYRGDKWDGLDTFYLQEFDASLGDKGGVKVIGEPIVVDR